MINCLYSDEESSHIVAWLYLERIPGGLKKLKDIEEDPKHFKKFYQTFYRCCKIPLNELIKTNAIDKAKNVNCELYYLRDTGRGKGFRAPFIVCTQESKKYAILSHYFTKDKTEDENSHFQKACELLADSCNAFEQLLKEDKKILIDQ